MSKIVILLAASILSATAFADVSQDPDLANVVQITGKSAKQLNKILETNSDANFHRAHLLGRDTGIMVEDLSVGNVLCERNIKVNPEAADPNKLDGKVTCTITLEGQGDQ
ncbi:MAG TPA: hypothetical protein VF412_03235 [Bdellovibrio sp.]|uniref:hypothetical protein n=1 Tax=Bdellovibrio sp. TaxID=28201 RepID=UPI002EE198CB